MTSANTVLPADISNSDDASTTPSATNASSPASSVPPASDFQTETDEFGVTHGLSSWATGRYIRICAGTGKRPDPEERPITCVVCARKWKSMRRYFEGVAERAKKNGYVKTQSGRKRRLEDR